MNHLKSVAHIPRVVRRTGLLVIPALLLAGYALVSPRTVAAACTAPATNYGTATSTASISNAGTYRVWSRIMAPDSTNNSYLLEIDGATCYTVGDGSIGANSWTWVDYQNGTSSTKNNITLSAGSHTLKMIGREAGVKLDRVLLVSDLACVPTGTGDNCATVGDTTAPSVSVTVPTNNTTVSGTVAIQAQATDAVGVSKVEFYVNGILKSTDTTLPYSYDWNSTTGANGSYSLMAKAYDAAGNTTSDTVQVTAGNNDTQAPSMPSGIVATAAAYNRVNLAWAASTDNTGVSGYWIARDGVTIAQVGAATSYSDMQVAPGTSYSYRITAYDAASNNSQPSAAVSVTTPKAPDTQAPSTPVSLSAAAISSSQINLTWSASTDNIGVTGYDIYRATGSGSSSKISMVTGTSFGDANLSATTQYTYRVVARDAASNTSPQSNTASATTHSPPAPTPVGGEVKGTVKDRRQKKPLSGVQVVLKAKRGARKIYTTTTNGTYDITGLPAGTYTIQYRKSGYRSQTTTVKVKSGKVVTKDISLRAR